MAETWIEAGVAGRGFRDQSRPLGLDGVEALPAALLQDADEIDRRGRPSRRARATEAGWRRLA